ncbi:MAG: DUF2207 domain-containing protein [Burkholderiaceae bacterium]|nr:DUF2207 domain-containing protein [Microbacteriaceae bacterium]
MRGNLRIVDRGDGFALRYTTGDDVDAQEAKVLDALFGTRRDRVERNLSGKSQKLATRLAAIRTGVRPALIARGWRVTTADRRPRLIVVASTGVLLAAAAVLFVSSALSDVVSGWVTVGLLAAGLALFVAAACTVRPAVITREGAQRRDYVTGLRVYLALAEAERFRMLQSPEGADRVGSTEIGTADVVKLYERLLPWAVLWGVEKEGARELATHYDGDTPEWYLGGSFSPATFAVAISGFGTTATAASVPASAATGSGSADRREADSPVAAGEAGADPTQTRVQQPDGCRAPHFHRCSVGSTAMLRVMSYNLRKNKASDELVDLVHRFDLDMLCLQECDTINLPAEVDNLHLADSTKRNRLGLAVYYRRDRFTAVSTKAFALKKSLHDRVLTPAHERLIGTKLVDNQTSQELVVASFHAAPLTALNSLRRNQIKAAHAELRGFGQNLPTLMVGDYNYPYFQNNLTTRVNESGYDLSLSDRSTYTRYKFFTGHFDFVTSVGLRIDSVETLPSGKSDHMPILVAADYGAQATTEADIEIPA